MSGRKAGKTAIVTDGTREADLNIRGEMPRVLIFATALICGLFLALAVHIALTRAGAGLTSMWRDLFPGSMDQLRSALAWWAIGASACFGSWGTITLLRNTAAGLPWHRFLRLVLGLSFFCLLAAAAHSAPSVPGVNATTTAGANLAAMSLAAFMAFCAAHFTVDR